MVRRGQQAAPPDSGGAAPARPVGDRLRAARRGAEGPADAVPAGLGPGDPGGPPLGAGQQPEGAGRAVEDEQAQFRGHRDRQRHRRRQRAEGDDLGPDRGTVIYGWVFAAHQIGGSIAAFGAAVLRVKLGDYALSFYLSGALCLITSYFVLQIAKGKDTASLNV